MPNKVRWGVLGAANIAVKKVIPAMQRGEWSEVLGLASRDVEKARAAARGLGVPKVYGSYEGLLGDPELKAVYHPLPDYLHLPWTAKAAQARKHVLRRKPVSMAGPQRN